MKAMKFKKISDNENCLGYDEIIILDHVLRMKHVFSHSEMRTISNETETHYEYMFLALAGGQLHYFLQVDWFMSQDAYEFVEFVGV